MLRIITFYTEHWPDLTEQIITEHTNAMLSTLLTLLYSSYYVLYFLTLQLRQGTAKHKRGAQEGGNRNGAPAAIGTNVTGGAECQREDYYGFATVSIS